VITYDCAVEKVAHHRVFLEDDFLNSFLVVDISDNYNKNALYIYYKWLGTGRRHNYEDAMTHSHSYG
jgi:hypothetical protein